VERNITRLAPETPPKLKRWRKPLCAPPTAGVIDDSHFSTPISSVPSSKSFPLSYRVSACDWQENRLCRAGNRIFWIGNRLC